MVLQLVADLPPIHRPPHSSSVGSLSFTIEDEESPTISFHSPLLRSLNTLIATCRVSQLLRSCKSISQSDCRRSRRWISVFRCTNRRCEVRVRLPAHSRYVSRVPSRSVPLRRS